MGDRIVTVSATYGSGGSIIAPRLAERLGLGLLDRPLPASALTTGEALGEEEEAGTPLRRWLARLAHIPSVVAGAPVGTADDLDPARELQRAFEAEIHRAVAPGAAVVLGRAAAVVLAGRPGAFHVRLDGPVERRVARAVAGESIDVATARRRLDVTDRARHHYVRQVYRRDANDPALYHLVLDSTVLPVEAVVSLLADAASAFWAAGGGGPA